MTDHKPFFGRIATLLLIVSIALGTYNCPAAADSSFGKAVPFSNTKGFPIQKGGGAVVTAAPSQQEAQFPQQADRRDFQNFPSHTCTEHFPASKTRPVKQSSPIRIAAYFFVWYLVTIASSSAMTSASKAMPLPWFGTAMRLWVGSIFITTLWKTGVKPQPVLSKKIIMSVSPVSAMSTLTLLLTGMAYAAGSLPFVSIVKSAEPAVMALLNAAFFGQRLPAPVYASLIPVIGGVGLASLKELNFSALCLALSMTVNVTSSLRSIMAKGLTDTGLTPSALTGLNSILGALMLTPVALVLEGAKLLGIYRKVARGDTGVAAQLRRFLALNCASGVCLFLFYEGNFLCLRAVGPLSHSIGSTVGRVAVIAAGTVIYGARMAPLNALGAALAVGGVLLYSHLTAWHAAAAAGGAARGPPPARAGSPPPPPGVCAEGPVRGHL